MKKRKCTCQLTLVDGRCPAGCEQHRRPHRRFEQARSEEREQARQRVKALEATG